ncbi:hypothetical protein B0A50_08568 [Salinomyces thailandicus]|uniref:Autophagy-related protein 14 n=1 Tax=Salinomyces thailandicus TaxID=706561 RepID=A0A4U0TJC3_9PEZI|nr:hypothetical protein B0A50_08568 [Salinomyces thailandica]
MECGICSRNFDSRPKNRRPTCTSCAQALLYAPRIQQALALLDREKQHTHAEAILRPGNDGVIAALPEDADWDAITAGVKTHGAQKAERERLAAEARIDGITEKAQELRQQMETYRSYIKERRELHTTRRQDIQHEHLELQKQKARALEPVQFGCRKATQRLEKVRNRTVEARALLCREAAILSGLQRNRDVDGKARYWLGQVPLLDLRELNGKLAFEHTGLEARTALYQPHELVNASTDNICRLLGNCCHYLSVRMPAEVLLPHDDFPHAVIMPEKVSYKTQDLQYPFRTSSQSSSPVASRFLDRRGVAAQRARPLHLDRPLRDLAKEDPKAFSLLTEGMSLLAWDIAWLCRTQGFDAVNTFDDFCAMGRNLQQLFVSPEPNRPTLDRNPSSAAAKTDRSKGNSTAPPRLGFYSHASAHHSLAGPEGLELLSNWRLASSHRMADRLKSYLLNEITGAEWDFLSDKEWDEDRADEQPVLVGGERRAQAKQDPAMSIMTVAPHDGADEGVAQDSRQRGNSGWMKLRGRGGDA